MYVAASNSDPEVIKALVKAGADVNAKSSLEPLKGYTSLMFAVTNLSPNPDAIITLLELGADPKMKHDSGKMAIDYARCNFRLWNTDALKKLEEASK